MKPSRFLAGFTLFTFLAAQPAFAAPLPAAPPTAAAALSTNPTGLSAGWQGFPVGSFVSGWVQNDLRDEPDVWYIQPLDATASTFTGNGYTRLLNYRDPARTYRPGHTILLATKDAAAFQILLQTLYALHSWVDDTTQRDTFFRQSSDVSELTDLLNDPGFVATTGLMVFSVTAAGTLSQFPGSWTPPPAQKGLRPLQALLAPGERTLWILAEGRTSTQAVVLSVDLATGTLTRQWTHLGIPTRMALSPEGDILYLHSYTSKPGLRHDSFLLRVDAATGQVLEKQSIAFQKISGLSTSPAGALIVHLPQRRQLWVHPVSLLYLDFTQRDSNRPFEAADGSNLTASLLEEIAGGGVLSIQLQDSRGNTYTIKPNSFQQIMLSDDGTIYDGVFTEVRTGNTLTFRDGQLVKSVTTTWASVDTPEGPKGLTAQVQTDAQGQMKINFNRMDLADAIVRATMGKSLQQLEEEAKTSPEAARQLEGFWEEVYNAVTGLRFKTNEQLALEKARAIDAIVKVGQSGDILMVGGPGVISVAIRDRTFAPVNHAAYLERAGDGSLWVIDINPRILSLQNQQDMLRTPFAEWVQNQTVIVTGRPNSLEMGENPVDYLKRPEVYGYNPATNTFENGPHYNFPGALFGGDPYLGDFTRNDPNRKFCSELICDTQYAIGKPLLGLPQNSWRTPGDLLRAMPQWGVDLLDLVPPDQTEGN